MLVPICEECYEKNAARARIPFLCQDPGMPIKEYLKIFQIYLLGLGNNIDTEAKNRLFVHSLSDKNKEEINKFLSIYNAQPTDKNFMIELVNYLEYLEHLDDVFGKKDEKHK
jgi:hypothetical protein